MTATPGARKAGILQRLLGNRMLMTSVKLVLAAALLYWVCSKINWQDMRTRLATLNWWWFALGATFQWVVILIAIHRLQILLRAQGVLLGYLRTLKYVNIGLFFNVMLPGGAGGDVLKIYYVAREAPDRKPEIITAVLLDRCMGLVAVVTIAACALIATAGTSPQLVPLAVPAALVLLAVPPARIVHAQLWGELLPIESMTLSNQQILTGEMRGEPVTIAGELRLPRGGTDKLPAVILVAGSGGLAMYIDDWARVINGWGIAVFIQDSLSGRGLIDDSLNNPKRLTGLARIIDTYRSLGRLAQHPRIDPNRIAVMGFSLGAESSLWSSYERFRKLYGPPNAQFAAHIGVYSSACNTQIRDEDKVSGRPLRLFHGTVDDWSPVEQCRAYVARLKNNGVDISLTEFPGVTHVYDRPMLKERLAFPQAVTFRHCSLVEGEGGQTMNSKTGKLFDLSDPCIEKGAFAQYDEAATVGTREGVKALLASVFGLKL